EHGGLHLFDEDAPPPELGERGGGVAVAGRLHDHQLGPAEQGGDVLGLPAGERAPPRGDAQHRQLRSTRSRRASARRSPRAVPAASFSRTVGSCSSLATTLLVTASSASRSVSVSLRPRRSTSARRTASTCSRSDDTTGATWRAVDASR